MGASLEVAECICSRRPSVGWCVGALWGEWTPSETDEATCEQDSLARASGPARTVGPWWRYGGGDPGARHVWSRTMACDVSLPLEERRIGGGSGHFFLGPMSRAQLGPQAAGFAPHRGDRETKGSEAALGSMQSEGSRNSDRREKEVAALRERVEEQHVTARWHMCCCFQDEARRPKHSDVCSGTKTATEDTSGLGAAERQE